MALGAIEALEQMGIDPSETPIVGIDATSDGLQAVQEGKKAMTVFQNAEAQGSTATMSAINRRQTYRRKHGVCSGFR